MNETTEEVEQENAEVSELQGNVHEPERAEFGASCPHVGKNAPEGSVCEDCYNDLIGHRQEHFCN